MGGGKRKFNQVKYVPKDKRLGKFVEEEKKEHKPEDIQNLVDFWTNKKKKENTSN